VGRIHLNGCPKIRVHFSTLVGPSYPPPGGVDWSGNGVNAADGTAVWNYDNFNANAFNELYFGLNQLDYGPAGAGLSGTADTFSLFGVSGQTAEWRANTTWFNPGTQANQAAETRLTMTVTGLGATPWITDLASIGLDVGFGDLGAVVDNSNGLDFVLTWNIQANTGSGWQTINSVLQDISNTGDTRSSVGTGFYSAVPIPAAAWLFGSGLLGLVGIARRKKSA
jgi:hypothetical protein